VRITTSSGPAPSRATLIISITLVMAIWAYNFLVVKIALRYFPPVTLASFRVVLASILMLCLAPLCRRLFSFQSTKGQGITARDLWTFAYLGFFGVTVNQLCFTIGLRYTDVTHSSIILGMGPIYTLALTVAFRMEKPTLRKAAGMLISLAGVTLIATGGSSAHRAPTLLGDAITLCGSLGFAFYVVLGKRVAAKYDAITMTTWNFIFGGLLVVPLAIYQAATFGPAAVWRAVPLQAWAALVYVALFSSTIAYLVYFWLLRYLEASEIASFSYLLPISASALGILFLGERGSWLELLGAALAFLGLYAIESSRR
jgi:drug/metabolite transporter (DMT)-like permease